MPLNQIRCKPGQNIDYWVWYVSLVELWKNLPNFLSDAASLNKNEIITAVNDIRPRAQACIESRKDLIVNFYCGYLVLKYPTLSTINNTIITTV